MKAAHVHGKAELDDEQHRCSDEDATDSDAARDGPVAEAREELRQEL